MSEYGRQLAGLEALAWQALGHWDGEFTRLEFIKFRENAVFCAYRADGVKSALRIHRTGYHSEAALNSELAWMQHLAAAGIAVPQIVRTRSGQALVQVSVDAVPEPRHVDMLAWIDGQAPGSAGHGLPPEVNVEALFFQAGQLAARIHLCSAHWQPPPGFVRHAWDEEGLLGEPPFWGRFWELAALTPAQRALFLRIRDTARAELRRYGRHAGNFGMLHADLVPENLLLHEGALHLIDFDDCGFGWYLFELATALYFCLDDPRFETIQTALLAGYRTLKPLDGNELALMPLFLALRGATYLGWLHTRPGLAADELAPLLIARGCELAQAYLDGARID